jgi:hypothetical protein
MSGPIVRTGTTPKFWENWDKVFGKGKGSGKKTAQPAPKAAAKKKPAAKKPAAKRKKG